jgi:hypothetical protein
VLEGETLERAVYCDAGLDEVAPKTAHSPSFEDMHWSDAARLNAAPMLPITGEIPVAFIFIMRNERQAPSWQIKRPPMQS